MSDQDHSKPEDPDSAPPAEHSLIVGTGEMADRIRSCDWAATPLGELRHWAAGFLSHVNTMLATPKPTALMIGPDFVMIYNDAYANVLSTKHPAALGRVSREIWKDIWHAIGWEYNHVYQQRVAIERTEVLIPLIRNGAPQDFYWNYWVNPLYVSDEFIGILATGYDVTSSVLARNLLSENEERLRLALSATGFIGMWDWHVQEDLVFADERFARAYGADPKQVHAAGMPIQEFLKSIHPDDLKHVHDDIVRSINSGGDFLSEYRLLQPDGSHRWVEARGRCLLDDHGTPVRFPGVTIDISRRKLAEAALATGFIDTLPHASGQPADPPLLKALGDLRSALTSEHRGQVPQITTSTLDEDFLRATNELISRDLALRSVPAANGGVDPGGTGSSDIDNSFTAHPATHSSALPVDLPGFASDHQKRLLYSITLLLNDWVRSIVRDDHESTEISKLVH